MVVDVGKVRGALGAAVKYGNPERAVELRADLLAALIENHIEKLLHDAPPLSAGRAGRLHAVLAQYTETQNAATTGADTVELVSA